MAEPLSGRRWPPRRCHRGTSRSEWWPTRPRRSGTAWPALGRRPCCGRPPRRAAGAGAPGIRTVRPPSALAAVAARRVQGQPRTADGDHRVQRGRVAGAVAVVARRHHDRLLGMVEGGVGRVPDRAVCSVGVEAIEITEAACAAVFSAVAMFANAGFLAPPARSCSSGRSRARSPRRARSRCPSRVTLPNRAPPPGSSS